MVNTNPSFPQEELKSFKDISFKLGFDQSHAFFSGILLIVRTPMFDVCGHFLKLGRKLFFGNSHWLNPYILIINCILEKDKTPINLML